MLTCPCTFQIFFGMFPLFLYFPLWDLMVLCLSACADVVSGMTYQYRRSAEDGYTNSPHTGLLLSTSSKTLPTTIPGVASTSGQAAISTRDQRAKVRADRDLWASAWVHVIGSNIHCEDPLFPLNNNKTHYYQ